MMRILRWMIILFLIVVLSGCIQVETLIKVNKDGSGTVERIFLMKNDILEMFKGMGNIGSEGEGEDFNLLKKDEMESEALSMGKGVTLFSAEPYKTEDFTGYKAVFKFTDINELKINQNPGESVPESASGGESVEEIITFSFKKGPVSRLEINMPAETGDFGSVEDDEDDPGTNDEDLAMMKQIYESMKMSLIVEVNGTIERTNAVYQSGNEITLMEMDFGKIVGNEKKFAQLANTETIEEMKGLIEDIPGIKVETGDAIEILFR